MEIFFMSWLARLNPFSSKPPAPTSGPAPASASRSLKAKLSSGSSPSIAPGLVVKLKEPAAVSNKDNPLQLNMGGWSDPIPIKDAVVAKAVKDKTGEFEKELQNIIPEKSAKIT